MAVSKRLRFEILKRDGFKCKYCHGSEVLLTVDHVTPKSLGGTDDPGNLVACCDDCNAGKTSSLPGGATVGDADEDLLRWTWAIRRASRAAFERGVEKEAYRGDFKLGWDRWRLPQGQGAVPLPEDWGCTVDELYGAGLPAWVWHLAIRESMAGTVHGDRFQHASRVAWQWVKELRGNVQLALAHAEESAGLAEENWSAAYEYNSDRVANDELRAEVRERAAKYLADGVAPDALLHAATAGGICGDEYFRRFERKDPQVAARVREAVTAWRRAYVFRQFDDGIEAQDVKEPDLLALDSIEQDVTSAIELDVEQLPILASAVEAGRDLTCELSPYLSELAEYYDEFTKQFTSDAEGGTV